MTIYSNIQTFKRVELAADIAYELHTIVKWDMVADTTDPLIKTWRVDRSTQMSSFPPLVLAFKPVMDWKPYPVQSKTCFKKG